MTRLAIMVAFAACGGAKPDGQPLPPQSGRPISVEWRAEQAEGDQVSVIFVVDGKPMQIGTLDAATEDERGTPATCALRAAHPLRTEFMCGMSSFYRVELHSGELVITLVDGDKQTEVKRVPVFGEGLAVKPYAM